jgi:hypothetical protein
MKSESKTYHEIIRKKIFDEIPWKMIEENEIMKYPCVEFSENFTYSCIFNLFLPIVLEYLDSKQKINYQFVSYNLYLIGQTNSKSTELEISSKSKILYLISNLDIKISIGKSCLKNFNEKNNLLRINNQNRNIIIESLNEMPICLSVIDLDFLNNFLKYN